MVEFDENTVGHHDLSSKNNTNIFKMSAAMDMYFSMNDSMSFQDMLDIDIKSEIDSLVGGHNDLSGFNFSDLPPLDIDDGHEIRWATSNSNLSSSSLNLDSNIDESTMVNPNAVMPVLSLTQSLRSPSPTLKESHLTFSPSTIKITAITQDTNLAKKDLTQKLDEVENKKSLLKITNKSTPSVTKPIVKSVSKPTTLLSFRNAVHRQMSSPVTVAQINNLGTVKTITTATSRKSQINNRSIIDDDQRAYPKPAYSYSCLIAMALKNSRSGSLPVSEIYNFMCRHFPYFKTAPTGWKNSVRHNLSLNKCFEKIEKPAINGTQRKGCLWAMNPSKISKMDEEVQKWSRKDPTAIRKAMINPEHLESLERGELKFSSSYDESENFGDSCGSAEEGSEEGSDSETEQDYSIINTSQLIDVSCIKEDNDESDYEVSESMYDDEVDMEEDKEILRVEMALAQKELLEYERNISMKKRKLYLIQN